MQKLKVDVNISVVSLCTPDHKLLDFEDFNSN